MKRILSLLLLPMGLAGCLGHHEAPVAPLFLELHNDTAKQTDVTFALREVYGYTNVYEKEWTLKPDEHVLADEIQVLRGHYMLRAEAHGLRRDVDVKFGEDPDYYRFVILDDVIAFQKVDG